MTSPFRYRKKQRKRLRALAKKDIAAAEKFESDNFKSGFAAGSRRMAEMSYKLARLKRRKKKPKLETKTGGKSRH
jgi:hypothetical protein